MTKRIIALAFFLSLALTALWGVLFMQRPEPVEARTMTLEWEQSNVSGLTLFTYAANGVPQGDLPATCRGIECRATLPRFPSGTVIAVTAVERGIESKPSFVVVP